MVDASRPGEQHICKINVSENRRGNHEWATTDTTISIKHYKWQRGESRCSRSVRSSRLLEDIGRCYILYLLIYYVWNIFAVISALKQRSVRLYLQLFVGGLTSCFRWLCFLAYNGVQHILTIWVTRRVSYKKQELLSLRGCPSSAPILVRSCCFFLL